MCPSCCLGSVPYLPHEPVAYTMLCAGLGAVSEPLHLLQLGMTQLLALVA